MNKFLPLIITLCIVSFAKGQTTFPICDIDERVNESFAQNPELKKSYEELEQFTRKYVANYAHNKKANNYVIPIVFHVIYSGSGTDVSKAQIKDAVRIINEDFQKLNADSNDMHNDFKSIVANSEIEFRLATLDPNGNCTEGITHHESEMTFAAGENVKSLEMWPVNKYLNVWVVQNIASGAGAYAYYPGTAPGGAEGIVCRASQLGGIGQSNGGNFSRRTLTHEIGHYMNLPHTWGNSNNNAVPTNCNGDDGVSDTPNTIGSNQNCNLNQNTCGSLDNVENYMDYATCSKMYTEGQKQRMHAALNSGAGGRNNLWKESNLIATGTSDNSVAQNCAPIANFSVSNGMICQGESVVVTDQSYNSADYTRTWTFNGADITSSSDSIVTVPYSTPGIYDISLNVTNAAGGNVATITQAVRVISTTPQHAGFMRQGFSTTTLPSGWEVVNPEGQGFEVVTSADADFNGSNAIWIQNRVQGPGNVDELYLPVVNVKGVSSPKLTFYYAYAKKTSSSDDVLNVYVSTNCGISWIRRAQYDANELSTHPTQSSGSFVPAGSDEWKQGTVNLSSYATRDFIQIKLEFVSGLGNNLYLDRFLLGNQSVGVEEINMGVDAKIAPIPASSNIVISMNSEIEELIKIQLYDVMGKFVRNENDVKLEAGDNTHVINVTDLSNGVYFLRMTTSKGSIQRKIVVQH